jgi:hypothetical protein
VSAFLCVVLSCVGRGLTSGRSHVQGVLPIVYRFASKNPRQRKVKKRTIKKEGSKKLVFYGEELLAPHNSLFI